ncbi:MAG: T9SS type A sorting domain-containing protein [Crocinitomicaceae bacterium]|nr:T9SS type A sorting domain-containing protein [Crocinitomicaceae bacterium]
MIKYIIISALFILTFHNAKAQCTPQATISDDFESYAAGTGEPLPDCWSTVGDQGLVIGNRNTAGEANSGTNYISIYTFFTSNSETYIISPELSTIDGNHFAEFYIKSSDANSTIEYGTMSDPSDASTFVSTSSSESLSNVYQLVTTGPIPASTGHNYFAIKVNCVDQHMTARIDDFEWQSNGNTSGLFAESTNQFVMFPNPANNQITINGNFSESTKVNLFTIGGQLVKSQTINGVSSSDINIGNFPSGIYIVEIAGNRKRLIIQ